MELTSNESGNQVDRMPGGGMCHGEHKAGRVLRVGGGVTCNQGSWSKRTERLWAQSGKQLC